MNSIISNVFKNLKQIGGETVEIAAKNTGEVTSSVITGKALVGNLEPLTNQEENKLKQEEIEKQKEIINIKRDVEGEIEEVRRERDKKEKEEEQFLLNLERQRMAEKQERESMAQIPGNSKREAAKHQGQRGHKAHAPDPASMSATGEMTGGKID